MQLIEQTKLLLLECDASKDRFFKQRELDASPQFFEEVKPHADEIQLLLKDWKQNAMDWIKEKNPRYIHKMQIDNVEDAMNQFVVQSFYKETSKKRFLQSVQSVHYTLSFFLRYLMEDSDYAK
ncbi:YppE family protein [Lysinibacillus endophyticus]|uniref:YppE family protein n=1 Tax=Ureibacillus endophyticus TaxID=1978490 RepID=UPI00209C9F22|nr:YppE family protein [Lysinibacillus endophyticus]MCP1144314.1 YppE family protein [Lysinibacillus endophyticus]